MHNTIATTVLSTQIFALQELHASLQDGGGLVVNFNKAIKAIIATKGRVIVSGIGKSGHIANKIASTLASTGTAAFFIHPSEASHGDLGMIREEDVILLLSNSGETRELKDLINYAKRFAITLISIVRDGDSSLANASDVPLLIPNTTEANSVNAPTTSTTLMLALGDAIAVALMNARNFTRDQFSLFHPGGKLGSQLITVEHLMHKAEQLPLVHEDDKLTDAIEEITRKGFGCAAVLAADGILSGVITDGDLRRVMLNNSINHDTIARDVMNKSPKTIHHKTLAAEAISIMNRQKILVLFVVNDGKVIGLLHTHDCLKAGVH